MPPSLTTSSPVFTAVRLRRRTPQRRSSSPLTSASETRTASGAESRSRPVHPSTSHAFPWHDGLGQCYVGGLGGATRGEGRWTNGDCSREASVSVAEDSDVIVPNPVEHRRRAHEPRVAD